METKRICLKGHMLNSTLSPPYIIIAYLQMSLAISGQLNRAWKSRMISFSKLFDILTCVCQSVSSVSCQMEDDCHLTHRWGVLGSGGRAAATAPPHPSLRSILEQNHHGQSGNVYRVNRIDLISHALFTIQRGVDELRAHSSLKKIIRKDRNWLDRYDL